MTIIEVQINGKSENVSVKKIANYDHGALVEVKIGKVRFQLTVREAADVVCELRELPIVADALAERSRQKAHPLRTSLPEMTAEGYNSVEWTEFANTELERFLVPSENSRDYWKTWKSCGAPNELLTEIRDLQKKDKAVRIARHPNWGWFGLTARGGLLVFWYRGPPRAHDISRAGYTEQLEADTADG